MSTSAISSATAAPAVDPTQNSKTPTPPDAHQRALVQAVKTANAAQLFGQENELTFIMDRDSGRAVVQIVNRDTHEVVEQIPSESVLRIADQFKAE
jgi:uncharacterized FlaG/YvyC family protein